MKDRLARLLEHLLAALPVPAVVRPVSPPKSETELDRERASGQTKSATGEDPNG